MSKSKENELIKKLMRFVHRDAMNIPGFTRTKLAALVEAGYIKTIPDLYRLDRYRPEIEAMDGFDAPTFENLWQKIKSRQVTGFENFLVALSISNLGLAEAQEISKQFDGEIVKFETAIMRPDNPFDFTMLEGFNESMNKSIYEWFGNVANTNLWCDLKKIISFRLPTPASSAVPEAILSIRGKKVVITGTLRGYTRHEGNHLISIYGGIAQDRVTRDTDFLVIATNPGAKKIADADKYGIRKITEAEFFRMIE